MLLRQLHYLSALASERHFARAAERCGVSQPTLSAALRQLEDDLATAIVERGNRFRGFTPEGEIVLRWARRILADESGLRQELDVSRGALHGRLRLGVIPSANAVVPHATASFAQAHPHVAVDETETTSIDILRRLAAFELDAGITYTDNEPLEHVRTLPIYAEEYVAIVPRGSPLAERDAITWEQAAQLPLCLMRSEMQNRRIYDAAFASVGASPNVQIEVTSMMANISYLETGRLGSIMPRTLLRSIEGIPGIRPIALTSPDISKTVGLVIADRRPVPLLTSAFWDHVAASVSALGRVVERLESKPPIA